MKLKQSKTDQIKHYSEPIVPSIYYAGCLVQRGVEADPLFSWNNGHHLTCSGFVVALKMSLGLVGVDASGFNGYSFRIGAASAAAASYGRQHNKDIGKMRK